MSALCKPSRSQSGLSTQGELIESIHSKLPLLPKWPLSLPAHSRRPGDYTSMAAMRTNRPVHELQPSSQIGGELTFAAIAKKRALSELQQTLFGKRKTVHTWHITDSPPNRPSSPFSRAKRTSEPRYCIGSYCPKQRFCFLIPNDSSLSPKGRQSSRVCVR